MGIKVARRAGAAVFIFCALSTPASSSVATETDVRQFAIVPLRYQNEPALGPGITAAIAGPVFFNGPRSLDAYWRAESKNATGVGGVVLAPLTLPRTWTGTQPWTFGSDQCSRGGWDQYARTQRSYIHYEDWDHVVLVAPRDACGSPGNAAQGSPENFGQVSWMVQDAFVYDFFVRHELGHNLALQHGLNLDCRAPDGTKVSMSATCGQPAAPLERADSFDPMGWGPCSYSTWQREQAGWRTDVSNVSADGAFRVRATDAPVDGNPDALEIPRVADQWGVAYRIEWTKQTFPGCSDARADGLQIRVIPADAPHTQRDIYLLDGTPETAAPGDDDMPVGRTFDDPVAGLSITFARMIDANVAEIRVSGIELPGTAKVGGRVLKVTARAGDVNDVRVADDGEWVTVHDRRPLAPGSGCEPVGSMGVRCLKSGIDRVDVRTGDRDDAIRTETALPVEVFAGAGNDRLDGGPSRDGPTRFHGEAGTDTIDYGARTGEITVRLDRRAADGERGERDRVETDVENIIVGAGGSYVRASNDNNVITGGAGNDRIYASGGDDTVDAGGGRDRVSAGRGDDEVFGGDGDDYLYGGTGVDRLSGGAGNDGVNGHDGHADALLDCESGDRDRGSYDIGLEELANCERFIGWPSP